MKKSNHKWIMFYNPQIIEGHKKQPLYIYGNSKKELLKWYKKNKGPKWNLISITKIY